MNVKKMIRNNGLHWGWAVSLVATLGSLYFSEVMTYIPCQLCWIQRIFMYPLTIVLGIAAVRKDTGVTTYVLPLASIGGLFSAYHVLYEKTGWFSTGRTFCGIAPCNAEYINWLGFITIPVLALTAFVLIILLCVFLRFTEEK